ncbi:hypothetical protein [Paraburkholderia sp. 40]|uniref:hypothetical protein n=1 Tax=unclassified Paraburkholderia TaxID=2615204 RepID=UPI003D2072E9
MTITHEQAMSMSIPSKPLTRLRRRFSGHEIALMLLLLLLHSPMDVSARPEFRLRQEAGASSRSATAPLGAFS